MAVFGFWHKSVEADTSAEYRTRSSPEFVGIFCAPTHCYGPNLLADGCTTMPPLPPPPSANILPAGRGPSRNHAHPGYPVARMMPWSRGAHCAGWCEHGWQAKSSTALFPMCLSVCAWGMAVGGLQSTKRVILLLSALNPSSCSPIPGQLRFLQCLVRCCQ